MFHIPEHTLIIRKGYKNSTKGITKFAILLIKYLLAFNT